MVNKRHILTDGSTVPTGKVVCVDQVADTFEVHIDSMTGVEVEALKSLIQTKFKVSHILHRDSCVVCKKL